MPADVRWVSKHCLLDWLGVTLAGANEPVTRIVFEQVCRTDRADEATLLGFGQRTSALGAALLHGTAAHALDYDDTHWGLQGHPTAPVLGALWGLAERERASGAALLSAFVAGVEVECQLGRWLNPHHYARGFHATGTLGTFGATAAAAHLLGLDETLWLHAFGLAGTQAAGLKSAFGTMAKPLHAGRAAQTGLLSALLAGGGLSAHPSILDADQGFFATHAGPQLTAAESEQQRFAVLDTLFKYHAACHLTHATIDGVVELLTQHGLDPDQLTQLELAVDETCRGVCNIERPETGTQAKFSLKATAALALLGDATADPRTFSDERARSPELVHWLERVHVRFEPMPATRSVLSAQLRDGRVLHTVRDSGMPERDLERQTRRLREKFERLAPLSASTARAVVECVWAIDEQPTQLELLALLARG